jgi:hypothetical protein
MVTTRSTVTGHNAELNLKVSNSQLPDTRVYDEQHDGICAMLLDPEANALTIALTDVFVLSVRIE